MLWRRVSLIAGIVLHLVALWLLLQTPWTLIAILLHVLGSLAWGWGSTLFLPLGQQAAWWLPGSAALTFPGGGILASLALIFLLRMKPADHSGQRYLVWAERPQRDWNQMLPSGGPGMSIVEIFQSPREHLRRNAVLALRDLDPQLAIPLLRKGLQDSDEQVRIYSQNILSSLLERFEESTKHLELMLSQNPRAIVPSINLAEQYFELVYLDVAGDEETSAFYLSQAITLLERAAQLAPHDSRVAFLGLKYSLRARDIELSRVWLDRAEHCGIDPQQLLPWRMELSFLEGDWNKLNAQFASFHKAGYINERIESLAAFWQRPAVSTP